MRGGFGGRRGDRFMPVPYAPYGAYYPYGAFPMMRRRPRIRPRENDWYCATCGVHNFASRTSCRACHNQKDEKAKIVTAEMAAAAQPPRRAGDWDCPKCQFV